ncbi:MAG: cupredoxin domain-containing protein [Actinomycetota bacterium]
MNDTEPTPRSSRDRLLLPILLPLGILAAMAIVMILFAQILLNTSASAATVVALVVSVAILTVAGIAATRGRVGTSALGSLFGIVAGVAMISGAIALVVAQPGEHGEEGEGKEAFAATLVAGPNASTDGFASDELTFASDVPVDLEFTNEETGVPHDVVIFDSPDGPEGATLFDGLELSEGSTTYRIEPLREGTYFFHCSIHPSTMTGTLTVEQNASTGGELEQTIVAQNLQFDADELRFRPETPSTLVFDNEDAGIQHNVSIYGDDSLAEVLFQGEIFPGVAQQPYAIPALPDGEYYFHCDVHPDMAGQVVVAAGGGGGEGGGSGAGEGSGQEPPADDEVAPDGDDAPPGEPQEQETG